MKFLKFKSVISLALCLSMLIGMTVIMTACDWNEEPTPDESNDVNTPLAQLVPAVRILVDAKVGTKITRDMCQVVMIEETTLPQGYISDTDMLVGKFVKEEFLAGDYIISERISDTKPNVKDEAIVDPLDSNKDYIYVPKLADDVQVQKLIDDNPGKTIYFADGTYRFKKTVVISAVPSKAVSLEMGQFAEIKAENWTLEITDPLIKIGGDGSSLTDKVSQSARIEISGGNVNGNKIASGILVKDTDNVHIHHTTIKYAQNGLTVDSDNGNYDNINIVGTNNVNKSNGLIVKGSRNVFENMRISAIFVGVTMYGAENYLNNVHPLYTEAPIVSDEDSWSQQVPDGSIAFKDLSEGNFYRYCYSDQLEIGFYLSDNCKSIIDGCFIYWYRTRYHGEKHIGIYTPGRFNAVVCDTKVNVASPSTAGNLVVKNGVETYDGKIADAAYIIVGQEGGSGYLVNPSNGGENSFDNNFAYYQSLIRN